MLSAEIIRWEEKMSNQNKAEPRACLTYFFEPVFNFWFFFGFYVEMHQLDSFLDARQPTKCD